MNFFYELLLLLAVTFTDLRVSSEDVEGNFLNNWAAEIIGGQEVARQVAEQHGYRIVRSLDHIPDHYELERSDTPKRSRRSADHHTKRLSDDERVLYVEQQQHKVRVKRGVSEENYINENGQTDDPEFKKQWYLNQQDDTILRRDKGNGDLRVIEVWRKNITGRGSVTSIVDDGLEISHSDLQRNYDPDASYDFNGNDSDPSPRYDPTNENKHGTRCAGEIAMAANNKICGTGIAFNSKIGGIRMLDGPVTDTLESRALSFNRDYIQIYSSSWGPSDDGKTLEGPGKLTSRVLEDGVKLGRKGKGSIFVVASGNGGSSGDNCNCDGYTSSPFTISISSASQNGAMPYYSERCASSVTSAFSSGSYSEGKVVSADLHNKCTESHSGTSAAAPMVAGVIALLLEVNPNLSWREIQHIIIHSSYMRYLAENIGWYRNAAGYCVNLSFGFGLIDAEQVVLLGHPDTWKGIGAQRTCVVETDKNSDFPRSFKSGEYVEVEFLTDGCTGQDNQINSLEHIQVIVDINHGKRGNIYVEIQSPQGTITPIMMERGSDYSTLGFKMWPLMSVHTWGEEPAGVWTLRVADRSGDNYNGSLNSAKLVLYGTKEKPEHQKNMPKLCDHLKQYAQENRDPGRPSLFGSIKQHHMSHTGLKGTPQVAPAAKTKEKPHESPIESLKELLQSYSLG